MAELKAGDVFNSDERDSDWAGLIFVKEVIDRMGVKYYSVIFQDGYKDSFTIKELKPIEDSIRPYNADTDPDFHGTQM